MKPNETTEEYDATVDAMNRQFANISVQDDIRRVKRFSMPSEALTATFDLLATDMMNAKKLSESTRNKRMIARFGTMPIVVAKIWELIDEEGITSEKLDGKKVTDKAKPKHLLWALNFMKENSTIAAMGSSVKMRSDKKEPSENTLIKWIWIFQHAMWSLKERVIRWENRKTNDIRNDALASVDCSDFPFHQIRIPDVNRPGRLTFNKALHTPKGPSLRYEIATSILSSDFVHVSGPWMPGDWNDILIFRQGLVHKLGPNERVVSDKGLRGDAPDKVLHQGSVEIAGSLDKTTWCKRIEGRFESGFNRIKRFKCLKQCKLKGTPEEKVLKHEMMVISAVVLCQLEMELGMNHLYEVNTDGFEYERYDRV